MKVVAEVARRDIPRFALKPFSASDDKNAPGYTFLSNLDLFALTGHIVVSVGMPSSDPSGANVAYWLNGGIRRDGSFNPSGGIPKETVRKFSGGISGGGAGRPAKGEVPAGGKSSSKIGIFAGGSSHRATNGFGSASGATSNGSAGAKIPTEVKLVAYPDVLRGMVNPKFLTGPLAGKMPHLRAVPVWTSEAKSLTPPSTSQSGAYEAVFDNVPMGLYVVVQCTFSDGSTVERYSIAPVLHLKSKDIALTAKDLQTYMKSHAN